MPRLGSTAKAWTEFNTPERTSEEAPIMASVKAAPRPSSTVQLARAPRFSVTAAECSSAVPISQGMKLAFSTGSHAHQPPQPSS